MRRILCAWLSRGGKPLLRLAVAGMAVAWAGSAHASAAYLPILMMEYGYQGNCTVCHQVEPGVAGTASKPFAETLIGLGLTEQRPDLLSEVMQNLDDEDSDLDGVPDLIEITAQGDPNDPNIKPGGFTPAEYGCSLVKAVGHPGRSRDANPLAFMLSTLIAGILLLDRRRRLRRSA